MSQAPFWLGLEQTRDPYAARVALRAAPLNSPVFTGDPQAPTPPPGDNDHSIPTTEWVNDAIAAAGGGGGGGGNVSNSGTPTAGQYGKWVTSTTIEGVASATVLSDIGAQPAGSYQPLDGDLTAIAALTGTNNLYFRSAANTWSPVTIGSNLTFAGGTLAASSQVHRGHIDGLTIAWVSNTSFSIAAGQAADNVAAVLMALSSAITKTTSAWAAGSGNGGLDTGTIAANTWYHVHLIRNSSTASVDVTFSLNATTPTLTSGYNQSRRIGSVMTNASAQFYQIVQVGDIFTWNVPSASMTAGTWTTTAKDLVLNVPTGIAVEAFGMMNCSSGSLQYFAMYPKTVADFTVSSAGFSTVTAYAGAFGSFVGSGNFRCLTNTSGQVRLRSSDVSGTGSVVTVGWVDPRGRTQ